LSSEWKNEGAMDDAVDNENDELSRVRPMRLLRRRLISNRRTK